MCGRIASRSSQVAIHFLPRPRDQRGVNVEGVHPDLPDHDEQGEHQHGRQDTPQAAAHAPRRRGGAAGGIPAAASGGEGGATAGRARRWEEGPRPSYAGRVWTAEAVRAAWSYAMSQKPRSSRTLAVK